MPTPIATSTIAAQAFRLMELAPISSFADDSDQARAAAEQFPVALDMCLEACDWSFARCLVDLPELASLPAGTAADPVLPYSYQLPDDCLKVLEVAFGSARWSAELSVLRADLPAPLTLRYTARPTDEARLPATFRTAVAYRLAALLSAAWVGSPSGIQRLEAGADAALRQAMRNDRGQASAQRYDGRPDQPDWVTEALA